MAAGTLTAEIPVPPDLHPARQTELVRWAREAAVVAMFEAGEVSSGEGAALLGIPRYAFFDILRAHRVPPMDARLDADGIRAEAAANARATAK